MNKTGPACTFAQYAAKQKELDARSLLPNGHNTYSDKKQKSSNISSCPKESSKGTCHRGLSTLKKYHGDGMGLNEFFHHSAIISCITFHI